MVLDTVDGGIERCLGFGLGVYDRGMVLFASNGTPSGLFLSQFLDWDWDRIVYCHLHVDS
jgi:hypothetical protein